MHFNAASTQELTTLADQLIDLLVLIAPFFLLSRFFDGFLWRLALFCDGFSAMFRETFAIMHFRIAFRAIDHIALEALYLSILITPVTFLRFAFIIILNNLEYLRTGSTQFLIDIFSTDTHIRFLILLSARIADEELTASGEKACLRLVIADLAF